MLKRFVLLLVLLAPKLLFAQTYDNIFETTFALEVKQIDEFIERFDNNDSTLIKQFYKKFNSSVPLTRERLIKSLFNAKRTDWNNKEITEFIKQVNNDEKPIYLNFYDDNWYANVSCAIVWNGKPESIVLKLKVQRHPDGGSKWVIADVYANFLSDMHKDTSKVSQPVLPKPVDNSAFLNPMSHATDFLNVDMISKDPRNISNYLSESNMYSNSLCLFINECLNNHIKILHANIITYSFLQIQGWDIEIQQYNRQINNSGWLISKLIKLPS